MTAMTIQWPDLTRWEKFWDPLHLEVTYRCTVCHGTVTISAKNMLDGIIPPFTCHCDGWEKGT